MLHRGIVLVIMLIAGSTTAQVRLSFVGADGVTVGTYDEDTDASVTLDPAAFFGDMLDGSPWHFGFRIAGHAAVLGDSGPWYQCGSLGGNGNYWIRLEFYNTETGVGVPVVALHNGTTDVGAVEGSRWDGYAPTDFTHMFLHYASAPVSPGPVVGTGCQKYYLIPVTWGVPVPTTPTTWGAVKDLYDVE